MIGMVLLRILTSNNRYIELIKKNDLSSSPNDILFLIWNQTVLSCVIQ